MKIAVMNEALTRYESELKKLKQKLSAIQNGLRTIRKSQAEMKHENKIKQYQWL